jgi:two-component system cell cycle sensor histidine kinase/response regulator CckA
MRTVTGIPTVLVADDEGTVRSLVARTLRAAGFEVLEAVDGVDALEVASAYFGPIHVLLTDVRMPRKDGCALAQELRVLRPETRTLYMSGFLGFNLEPDAILVQKPFTPERLVRTVLSLVEGSPGGAS